MCHNWLPTYPGYPLPFNHSIIHAKILKIESSQSLCPRSIFGAFQLWFDYRLERSGLHLQLSKASPTEDHTSPGLSIVIPIRPPYLSLPVYIQCQCKNLAIDLLRNTPPSPNIARSSLNPGHNWFDAGFSNSNRKMRADQPLDKVTDA